MKGHGSQAREVSAGLEVGGAMGERGEQQGDSKNWRRYKVRESPEDKVTEGKTECQRERREAHSRQQEWMGTVISILALAGCP